MVVFLQGTDITIGLQNPTAASTYGDRSKDNNLLVSMRRGLCYQFCMYTSLDQAD
jgi:hypothetical protein